MLAGVKVLDKEEAQRLEREEKKHRKREKRKQKKQAKKDSRDLPAPDSNSSGDDASPPRRGDDQQAAQPATDVQPNLQRQDWMTVPVRRPAQRAEDECSGGGRQPESEEPASDQANVSVYELNPYFRDGGTGLPPEDARPTAAISLQAWARGGSAAPAGVGDGGASWRLKALQRAREQAAEQGKGLSEVVSDRWGSLGELTAGISERRPAHAMAHAHAARERRGGDGAHRERRHEGRRGEEERAEHPGRGEGGRKDRSGEEGGEGRHREQGSGRGRRERSGYLDEVRSARSQMRRPSDNAVSLSWKQAEGQRDGGGRRGGGGERAGRGPGAGADVLRAVAHELNAFAGDGSFASQFQAMQQGQGEDAEVKLAGGGAAAGGPSLSVSKGDEQEEAEPSPASRPQPPRPAASIAGAGTGSGARDNLSAAAALRARLSGRVPAATPTASGKDASSAPRAAAARVETIALPLVDASGRAAPGAFGRESAGAREGGARPVKRVERYEGGEKRRYYADDDSVDLATLVKRTKYEGAGDIDANIAKGIARRARYKAADLDADAEYDHDAGLDLADGGRAASKAARRRGSGAEEAAAREKQRQVRDYGRLTSALERCPLCFTSGSRPRHLTIAIGTAAYLALPPRGRLVRGHCQIVPAEHAASTRSVDESAWTEIRNFKKCLIQMNMARGLECVFVETAVRLGDARSHSVVDCVPLPPEAAAKAPMYFRKAVDDATSEWAQHHAKRFIDTAAKGLRGAIPPNFPYLNVEFGLGAGFVHVIDDEEGFDRSMARSVLIGLLGLPQEDMHRRANQESEAMQAQWAAEFRRDFDQFDWTKALG